MSLNILKWSLGVSGAMAVLGLILGGNSWLWWLWPVVCGALAWAQYHQMMRWFQPIDRLQKHLHEVSVGKYDSLMGMHAYGKPWPSVAESFQAMRRAVRDREQRLLETNQRMESVLGSMFEGVLAVDGNENIILLNQEAKRMLAVEQVDVLGRPLREVVRHPELIQAVTKANQELQPVVEEFITARSPRRLLSIRVAPLPGEQADGLTIVLEDVSERRQLETMRRDFVANVSHELKTPLTAIKAYAETLRLGAVHDSAHCGHFLEQIETQADRLHQLIVDLLHLSRVESGAISYEAQEFDLTELCQECLQLLSEEANRRQVQLLRADLPRAVLMHADREALRTIIDNLLINAIRYTPAQGTVSVRCFQARGWVTLEVKDSGIGIDREHHERIFERFYRVDRARSRDLGGTGLGLSIVKHLAQSFGGGVELESELGQGSTFRVRLPDRES
jgi:two-component system phosphate regulon sensor histidine kinase PhoR